MKEDRPVVANQPHVESPAKEPDSSRTPREGEVDAPKARTFTFANLVAATQNFKGENFLGEGGFGKVFKGCLQDTGEVSLVRTLLFPCESVVSSSVPSVKVV